MFDNEIDSNQSLLHPLAKLNFRNFAIFDSYLSQTPGEIFRQNSENSTAKAQNFSHDPFYLSSVFPTTTYLPTLPIILDGSLVTPTIIPPPPNPLR